MPLLQDVRTRDGQEDGVTGKEVHHAGDYGVQREQPQDQVRDRLARPRLRRIAAASEPREKPPDGAASLKEMHAHQCENDQSDDRVIRCSRMT